MDSEDAAEFLGELGLAEAGLNRMIKAGPPRNAPASFTAISNVASSKPKLSPMTITSPITAKPAPVTPAKSAKKVKAISSKTAIS